MRRPLANVPENELKFAVGLMLTTFGTFWGGEGVGLEWPLGDLTILVILAAYTALAIAAVRVLASDRATRRLAGSPRTVRES